MREWSDSWPLLLALSTYFHSAFLLRLLKIPLSCPSEGLAAPDVLDTQPFHLIIQDLVGLLTARVQRELNSWTIIEGSKDV